MRGGNITPPLVVFQSNWHDKLGWILIALALWLVLWLVIGRDDDA